MIGCCAYRLNGREQGENAKVKMKDQGKPGVNIVGVYAVPGEPGVHLVELLVSGSDGIFDVSLFTQELSDQPESNWQVAYDEHLLDGSGGSIIDDAFSDRSNTSLWTGSVRLVFFFHDMDFSKPLKTPFGEIEVPGETPIPERLSAIKYEPPY